MQADVPAAPGAHELARLQPGGDSTASSARTPSRSSWAPTTTRNGDGQVDSDGAALRAGRDRGRATSRASPSTLRSTHPRRQHALRRTRSTSYDYIQSDNTHPTYTGGTVSAGLFGGTGTGSGAPDYTDAQIVGGKNPIWNQYGHERMGWASPRSTRRRRELRRHPGSPGPPTCHRVGGLVVCGAARRPGARPSGHPRHARELGYRSLRRGTKEAASPHGPASRL